MRVSFLSWLLQTCPKRSTAVDPRLSPSLGPPLSNPALAIVATQQFVCFATSRPVVVQGSDDYYRVEATPTLRPHASRRETLTFGFTRSQARRAFPAAAVASKTKASSAHYAASSLVPLAPPTSLRPPVCLSVVDALHCITCAIRLVKPESLTHTSSQSLHRKRRREKLLRRLYNSLNILAHLELRPRSQIVWLGKNFFFLQRRAFIHTHRKTGTGENSICCRSCR